MKPFDPLGFVRPQVPHLPGVSVEHVLPYHPLHRILSFTGRSIDDVVNSRLIKNEVIGYYKLYCNIGRMTEIGELERQWNPLGRRT
ncbi:MAG TPA: hypothetical protein VFE58_06575 [Tepidisphaeraceae bacterium]|jgi:hypothetical protein|nr:hypothetical protein [Tepidisphaeraceae bacterium]